MLHCNACIQKIQQLAALQPLRFKDAHESHVSLKVFFSLSVGFTFDYDASWASNVVSFSSFFGFINVENTKKTSSFF